MKKISFLSICLLALVVLVAGVMNVYANEYFDVYDELGANPSCASCHPDIANFGPDHGLHADLSNNDCNSCHANGLGPGNNNPPLSNCVRCHGRDEDAGGDGLSPGLGRGLRRHHETAAAAICGNCHSDASGPIGVGEDVLPSYYPQALNGAGLDPCDGSEEQFPSTSVSLDNDGDGLIDGADPDCEPPECINDADCDDGDFCTGVETCVDGVCVDGTPVDCDDGVGCTQDSCDEVNDVCVNEPDDGFCDDGLFCNGAETCDPVNNCQAGVPPDCGDDISCTQDSCDLINDECINIPDDAACDDGDLCTIDTCDSISGCANTSVECPPGEECDPADGVCKVPGCTNDAECDNGMFCDGVETCDLATGTCQSGTPIVCDDNVDCTEDICDEAVDACVNIPDDSACDDGDVCNGAETCDADNDCQPGEPVVCDDGNFCTTDSCDPVAECIFTPVECPAGEQCDPADGQCKVPPGCTSDADCDDSMFCNGAETCDTATGTCQPGTPVDCDDGIECTVDTCDEVNDVCENTPDDTFCPDDGLFCNGDEICDPELCTGDDICDPAEGCVSTGDPCPEGSTCNEDTDTCDLVMGKVTICHIPPGNPAKAKTKSIDSYSVEDHLRHGDFLGPCP